MLLRRARRGRARESAVMLGRSASCCLVPAYVLIAVLVLLLPATSGAQIPSPIQPLFAGSAALELRITGPFRQLGRDDEERPEYPSTVEVLASEAPIASLDAELRVRGNSRVEICDFPPLRLDFERGEMGGTVFEGQNELKLVTLCRAGSSYRDYLILEFLAYRLLNALTERSFRVRWVEVEYVYDDARRSSSRRESAFLIEDIEEAAQRLGMEVVERESIPIELLDESHTALLTLYQYLIGNSDWSVNNGPPGDDCCHNGKLIGNPGSPVVVLAYDFDNAGLINAEYAVPNPQLPIRFVTQRLYRGFCVLNGQLEGAIAHVNARRPQMEALIEESSLSDRARGRALEYLAEGFERINDPERVSSDLVERCRSFPG